MMQMTQPGAVRVFAVQVQAWEEVGSARLWQQGQREQSSEMVPGQFPPGGASGGPGGPGGPLPSGPGPSGPSGPSGPGSGPQPDGEGSHQEGGYGRSFASSGALPRFCSQAACNVRQEGRRKRFPVPTLAKR